MAKFLDYVDETYPIWRASYGQCKIRNSSEFDSSILLQSGVWGAADEAVLNKVHKNAGQNICKKRIF